MWYIWNELWHQNIQCIKSYSIFRRRRMLFPTHFETGVQRNSSYHWLWSFCSWEVVCCEVNCSILKYLFLDYEDEAECCLSMIKSCVELPEIFQNVVSLCVGNSSLFLSAVLNDFTTSSNHAYSSSVSNEAQFYCKIEPLTSTASFSRLKKCFISWVFLQIHAVKAPTSCFKHFQSYSPLYAFLNLSISSIFANIQSRLQRVASKSLIMLLERNHITLSVVSFFLNLSIIIKVRVVK